MQLQEILSQYPEESLDQLARDKIDEIANVRLPRSVIEQEIATALSSFSYISEVLSGAFPPTYAFLKLLMEAPDHAVNAAGFRERVMERTDSITEWVLSGKGMSSQKNYALYRTQLLAAWEEGSRINESENRMLEALRDALGLSMREHRLLEHHPEVRHIWDSGKAYENARNYMLKKGLVLAVEDRYVLPDEVRVQIRRYWGMELHDADYGRLLDELSGQQLRDILDSSGLQLSGTKEERIERIVDGLVPPTHALENLSLDELKALSRRMGLQISLTKPELISQLITHFDKASDVGAIEQDDESGTQGAEEPHDRQLDTEQLQTLLARFSGSQLYEMLMGLGLPRSGSKAERIQRLVESGYSEGAILGQLRRSELVRICRKMELRVSGVKEEIIERICNAPLHEEESSPEESAAYQLAASEDLKEAMESDEAESAEPDGNGQEEVPGLDYISYTYPDLDHDKQVIMALLREARSLNERDVQRLAYRYGLGWTLPKAHMTELLRTLTQKGHMPVRVRSTGAANIYEWADEADGSIRRLDQWAARDIVDALRNGVVPERHLDMMFVGQQEARKHMQDQLEHVATGRSAFKFIRGAYGSGKTFMMAWLREASLNAGFAVSTVRVSAEMSLSDLSNFYSGLMDGLRVPEKRGANSLSDILEDWLLTIQRKTERVEGLSSTKPADRSKLTGLVRKRIQEQLSELASYDPGLAPALGAFYEARLAGSEEKAMAARAWLRGDRSLSNSVLKQLGVKGALEPEQVLPRLRALLDIIEATHLRGLVILVDELELVRRRPHKQTRDQAYETLRALLDEVGENRLPGCLLISTGTDTFFDDQRYGLASYEALYHRVSAPEMSEDIRSVRQPVIVLEGLNEDRLMDLADRARSIHATAYNWAADERVSDEDLRALVRKWTDFGGECIDRLPRPFLRQLVHVLDICEENPQIEASDCFAEPEEDPEANEALMRMVTD